jgi:hypothetical protein
MNLRWLWFDHIPPGLEVPKEARWRVWRLAWRCYSQNPNLMNAGLTGIGILFVIVVAPMVVIGLLPDSTWFPDFLVWPMVVFYCIHIPLSLYIAEVLTHRVFTRLALCQLGYLCCVKCGYVHTGLSKDVKECPECGAAREVREVHSLQLAAGLGDDPPR